MNSMSALVSPVCAENTQVSKEAWAASARSSESSRLPMRRESRSVLRSRSRPSISASTVVVYAGSMLSAGRPLSSMVARRLLSPSISFSTCASAGGMREPKVARTLSACASVAACAAWKAAGEGRTPPVVDSKRTDSSTACWCSLCIRSTSSATCRLSRTNWAALPASWAWSTSPVIT